MTRAPARRKSNRESAGMVVGNRWRMSELETVGFALRFDENRDEMTKNVLVGILLSERSFLS